MKLDYKKTFLIGFGFFASSIAWSLYNSFIPLMLKGFVGSTALIGLVMTIDNVFGVIFQPLFGQLSDRTHTRFGKRMPYIMVGIPICAVAFSIIPYMTTLPMMMAVIIVFNLVMSTWRSPVVALMPDVTPSPLRSKANGVINLMGGVGSIIAFLVGGQLTRIGGYRLSFLMGSVIMVFALFMLLFFVREPGATGLFQKGIPDIKTRMADAADQGEQKSGIRKPDNATESMSAATKHMSAAEKRSLFALLFAIFFWFSGYNAVETFFTTYATEVLKMDPGTAAGMLTFFSLTLVAFAIPSGILAGRLGRRKMILIGLVGTIAVFTPMLFIDNKLLLTILLLLGGMFWACININSLPMVVEMARADRLGSFTGYYYFFSFSAAIASPILFGLLRDLTQSYRILFAYSVGAFFIALICMFQVRHGEASAMPAATVTHDGAAS
jgi:maltose/moltooligosaccharide transporter